MPPARSQPLNSSLHTARCRTVRWVVADGKAQYYWSEETCYLLSRARLDGSDLVQLTDGPWNDFDPCVLPNGRIAFISERRGGFLRCGARPIPRFRVWILCRSDPVSDHR